VTASSPARSLRDGSEFGDKDLLLPEFDDVLYSAELAILSPRSARSAGYGADGFTDADMENYKAVSGEDGKSRGGRVGSRRSASPRRRHRHGEDGDGSETSDVFPDDPDSLLGDYVENFSDETAELQALRETVKVLKRKEARMEAELLDYYDLEDQEQELLRVEEELEERNLELDKLQSQLKKVEEEKNAQTAKLKERIGALEGRATKLADEAASVTGLRKDLEEARARIKELQRQLNTRTGNDKVELLMLKQKVATLETEKEDGGKRDLETERKLQALRDMEVEIVELRRKNKELQYQKRELTVKLDAAEQDVEYFQNRTEV
jgi:hypothetical protein